MKSLSTFLFLSTLFFFTDCSKKKSESCTDGIANQYETKTDCGGPCAACATCFDSILNQGETGIDCGGGVCVPCPSCNDGLLNQGETEVDCGGPCKKCVISYPSLGMHGKSIICLENITLDTTGYYSMKAELPAGNSLRIVMKNTTDPYNGSMWWYYTFTPIGWDIRLYDYENNLQEFKAQGKISCDVKVFFTGSGEATIEFYENNSPVANRVKNISW